MCEVEFTEWTRDGLLRAPSFKGLRDDKAPEEVRDETVEADEDRLVVREETGGRARAWAGATPGGSLVMLRRSRIAATDRNSAARVAADSYRRSRLFANALPTMASSSRGEAGLRVLGAGAAACTAAGIS